MNNGPLTEEKAYTALRNFFREKPFVFLGTGTSCSLDDRFGMASLKEELIGQLDARIMSVEGSNEWKTIKKSLQENCDLESALNSANNLTLIETITEITGNFIASHDREYNFRISRGEIEWPATKLFSKLVKALPNGDPILHALTTNYDLLLEYACDQAGILYTNGFSGGIERKVDWIATDCSLRFRDRSIYSRVIKPVCKFKNHVRIYKVHGSLNYFFHRNNVIENNAWMWNPPDGARRVIITPGLSKYERLQKYRQELLRSADTAIEKASSFLFIGYGFNDSHIEEYIRRKLISQGCKGIIVTRDCNPRIVALLMEAPNLWIVCKSERAGLEDTRIFNKQYSDWLALTGKRLWDIGEFTSEILGG